MSYATNLRCKECHASYDLEAIFYCEACFGPLEALYDLEAATGKVTRESIALGPPSLWRYRDLLPGDGQVEFGAGWTPLVPAPRLGAALGIRDLWLKDDTRNPTGSFKDRVVSVALANAKRLGFSVAACASTGNLATSVAAGAARLGWRSVTVIPHDLERSKVAMTAIYGGVVLGVTGSYDDVNRLCVELAQEHPEWAFVNINLRPYYAEGSKTLAFEMAEQLGWTTPEQVVVPIASGSQLTKIAKGFSELRALGLVEGDEPVLYGAQATGCSPVATAWANGSTTITPQRPRTIAKSLAIGDPADGVYVLEELKKGGDCGSVEDPEILAAIGLLARTEGIFAETAGGVVVASAAQMVKRGTLDPDKRTVLVISGHGLKTLGAVEHSAVVSATIPGTLSAALEVLTSAGF
jgi:threonine synthase